MLLICQNATMRVFGAWVRINYVLCLEHIVNVVALYWSRAGSQRVTRGARICETA